MSINRDWFQMICQNGRIKLITEDYLVAKFGTVLLSGGTVIVAGAGT